MTAMVNHRHDGEHQRAGIDRSIILDSGKQLWIDEKVRGRNKITGKVYTDIALEEWSDEAKRKPGWVVKSLLCDFVAYAIAPLGQCYLLPVVQLQSAWLQHSSDWKRNCFKICAKNNGYTTISWGIPVPVLFKAIGDCLCVAFEPMNYTEQS